jgi:hypothetical protein
MIGEEFKKGSLSCSDSKISQKYARKLRGPSFSTYFFKNDM